MRKTRLDQALRAPLLLVSATCLTPVAAHHGVAGLGAAGLQGPGAPIEAATSATLPVNTTLVYAKLDHANYKTFDSDPANPESDYANYWMAGIGYGFKSWFSGYVFLPYHSKVDEDGGFNTHGFADVNLFGQLGFKYDEGWMLIPENESLDDLEDWHFTVFGGFKLPTGNPDLRDRNGEIDPGKSTGFGDRPIHWASRRPRRSPRGSPSIRSSPISAFRSTSTPTATARSSVRRSGPTVRSSTGSTPTWTASCALTWRWKATTCIWGAPHQR